jgi:hypothetical protein
MACSTCRALAGPCGNTTIYLRNIRVRAVTLFNVIKVPIKQSEYQELIEEVDILLKKPQGQCPPQDIINTLNDYLDNEYSKYL